MTRSTTDPGAPPKHYSAADIYVRMDEEMTDRKNVTHCGELSVE